MGCVQTRPESAEENGIVQSEKCLGFHIQKSAKIDAVLRKFSTNGVLTEAQLNNCSALLKINTTNYGIYKNINDMLSKIRNEEGDCYLQDLLVIGILLGKGTNEENATLIYQAFDEKMENSIPKERLESEVLEKMFKHSLVTLGSLYCNTIYPNSNELKNLKYITDLLHVKSLCISQISSRMCEFSISTITEEHFVRFISTFMNGSLLTPAGLRGYMRDTYALHPPRKTYSTPYTRRLANAKEQKHEKINKQRNKI
ncbi:unnamed protein product [Blepharisma stoltei]|uniref:Uncharacterized protein n=1 Tax=Blepharisma stoltei TaxID=1481888 RepID=A0AAU9JMV8_9CILI|nr:unnamed protein product [Blepharisma stoltei]